MIVRLGVLAFVQAFPEELLVALRVVSALKAHIQLLVVRWLKTQVERGETQL